MDMLEELKTMGVDVEEAVERFVGNAALYEKMLRTFPKMIRNSEVDPDFDGNDYADIIEKTHAIKGTSGNLSLTPIYKAYTDVVDLLRGGKPEEARQVLKDVLPVQEKILECIERHS